MKINVVMDFLVGGAYIGTKRITDKINEHEWIYTTEVDKSADIVLYMNNHKHYEKAKLLGIKHIIQRKTGDRSLAIPSPEDLDYVICASKKSFNKVDHKRKILIYNGVDLDLVNSLEPKPNVDWLVAESRIGVGQRVDLACEHAIKNKRHLTILGSKANLVEDTYFKLKAKYPQFNWVGTVDPIEALRYIKGCSAIIISNPSHGVANQALEASAMNKEIIKFADLEIPDKSEIDLNVTVKKYREIIDSIKM